MPCPDENDDRMAILLEDPILIIFFVYGLAFYTMGLTVAFESAAYTADRRTSHALGTLAAFGIIHGLHEWFEMFLKFVDRLAGYHLLYPIEVGRVVVLAFSFALLVLFGSSMLLNRASRSVRLGVPAALVALFLVGAALIANRYAPDWEASVHAADAWARYSLGITGGALAGAALIARGVAFHRRDLPGVARGWYLAGSALLIYGLIGQSAPAPSALFPSNIYNTAVFQSLFGFPVQMLRAAAAFAAMLGVLGALRGLERERQHTMMAATQARAAAEQRALEEIARREALQTELLRRTVTAQEAERTRIARELHDRTGQTLTALTYHVAALEAALAGSRSAAARNAAAKAVEAHRLADQACEDLRHLVTELRPAQLDDLGLVAGLSWLADQVRQQFGLHVDMQIDGQKARLSPEVETALFRVTQEALTNVARHAGVDRARVRLSFAPEAAVTLDITDEGRGFDPQHVLEPGEAGRPAWGIIGMQERVHAMGGTLAVSSQPGQGTTVHVLIPGPGSDPDG